MSTYETTYHFKTIQNSETGEYDERPIYYAFRQFLDEHNAIGDKTTSTRYFNYDGTPGELAKAISDYFEGYDGDVEWEEGDYISVITLYNTHKNGNQDGITSIGRIVNGEFFANTTVMKMYEIPSSPTDHS